MGNITLLLAVVLAGCMVEDLQTDEPQTSTVEEAVTASNRLASNRLASNRLASNRLASNSLGAAALTSTTLIDSADGREVFSYIVKCALPTGKSVTLKDSLGTRYTFAGEVGLAPTWQTTTPTASERRWVTACLLARTNYYGVSVQLSMRGAHPALATTSSERSTYVVPEGAFYGDLFDPNGQTWFACGTNRWTSTLAVDAQRTCTISEDGVTTMCGFTYAYFCGTYYDATHAKACTGSAAPWSSCDGEGVTYDEVISIYLPDENEQLTTSSATLKSR
jgi:hypothetical protein